MPVTHNFVDGKADGADTTVARPSDWNASHVGSPDLSTNLYDPGLDTTIPTNATSIFNTDPLIVDSGRLITVPSNSLLWLDAPRAPKRDAGEYNVKDFGAKGDGVTDDTTALQAARDFIAGIAQPATLVFPAGIYVYSVSPNWAIFDAYMLAQGEVRLRYTGTGNAVILDGGTTTGVYNTRMMRFIVESTASALNGVYFRGMHTGKFEFKVTGCGSASAGIRTEWCVASEFYVAVSVNHEGWYQKELPNGSLLNRPFNGIYVDADAARPTSYCNFYAADVAGVGNIGIYLNNSLGNNFYGGTSEACVLYGVYAGGSHGDKFLGMDFEANVAADIYAPAALDTAFIECDSNTLTNISTGAKRVRIVGGNYSQLTIDGTADSTLVDGAKYNRNNDGKLIIESAVNTQFENVLNVGTGAFYPNAAIFTSCTSDFTGTNVTTAQPVFNTTEDSFTASAFTTYKFEGIYHIHTTGTANHTFGILFGGTASLTDIGYAASVTNAATEVLGAEQTLWCTAATVQILTAATATATHHTVRLHGLVRINATGTFIPQYQWGTTAPGVAGVTLKDSYFQMTPLATNTQAARGLWA